jgi:hypothetical protein
MPLPGAGGYFLFYSKKKVTKESAVGVRRPFLQMGTPERKQPPNLRGRLDAFTSSQSGAKKAECAVEWGKIGLLRVKSNGLGPMKTQLRPSKFHPIFLYSAAHFIFFATRVLGVKAFRPSRSLRACFLSGGRECKKDKRHWGRFFGYFLFAPGKESDRCPRRASDKKSTLFKLE